ncbi:hypothetical protein K1X45_02635 [Pseudochrobactrum sp. Wa41.01b-1]|uniref:hypothetical protein n=1 Tax=Pseudochrobactrum sp. Wa41.01b-1 TaxID=2864102 RepID=UPI001C6940A2|nr:hypothetical protein [Pseudochrobactrum sp. Wa41.01b-1]QYM73357.1 hypothetical protein K1X45_02635 [Pseudochrobactrum sp. Wa41.01b-1]
MNLNLGDTRRIISACLKYGLLRNQAAYVLATAFWETARTMKPVREMGGEKYLRSKKYYPYVGMGYVQLTWRENYQKASDKLSVDFVSNPKLLLDPVHATEILVLGMIEGWFTGKKLSDYITLQRSDFVEARQIINSKDKASDIARIAREYDRDLKAEGYGEQRSEAVIPVTAFEPQPVTKSKRFWTWLTAAALPALGLLDWRVQLASVVIGGGLAGYAIYSMPSVKAKITKLIEAL